MAGALFLRTSFFFENLGRELRNEQLEDLLIGSRIHPVERLKPLVVIRIEFSVDPLGLEKLEVVKKRKIISVGALLVKETEGSPDDLCPSISLPQLVKSTVQESFKISG